MSEIRLTLTLDDSSARILSDLAAALRAAHPNCDGCVDTVCRTVEGLMKPSASPAAEAPEQSPVSAPMPAADDVPPFAEEPSAEEAPVPEQPAPATRTVTEEDLRDVALRLIRARRREEVAEVVHRYADRISSITDPRDRIACYDALIALEAA